MIYPGKGIVDEEPAKNVPKLGSYDYTAKPIDLNHLDSPKHFFWVLGYSHQFKVDKASLVIKRSHANGPIETAQSCLKRAFYKRRREDDH